MEPIHLARGLALVNVVVDASFAGVGQAIYDDPRRGRRWAKWAGLGLAGGIVLNVSDAVWSRATKDRTTPLDPSVVLPAHETDVTLQQLAVAAAFVPVWWFGRGVPERLRRKGIDKPNTKLAVPLTIAFAAASAPGWFRHARARAELLD